MLKKLFKKLNLGFVNTNILKRDEQCVIVDGNFESGEEFGTQQERDVIVELEKKLRSRLQNPELNAEYDGHGFGEGAFTLFMYGRSADVIFNEIEELLKKTKLNIVKITLRYGPPKKTTNISERTPDKLIVVMNSSQSIPL